MHKRAIGLLGVALLIAVKNTVAIASPIVFRVSEPAAPGDALLLNGGGLSEVHTLGISRLTDSEPGNPDQHTAISNSGAIRTRAIQRSEGSVKFILPASLQPGVFAADIGGGAPVLIGQPRVYWCQPIQLLPGLVQNEAAPGSTLDIIGRNFIPEDGKPGVVIAVLQDGARLIRLRVSRVDKYSLLVDLPANTPIGRYQLRVHNGYGGPPAWSGPLAISIKNPIAWPSRIFNVRNFGAHGDNIHDDSGPLRATFRAASDNGGGVVYFPAGTYRLNGWFAIPHRVILRGERRDVTWLKWPLVEPTSTSDLIPSVLYSSGEFGIEHLSLMARNTQTLLRDLSWDATLTGKAPIPELQGSITPPGSEHDVFIRDIDFQLLYYSGRPSKPGDDPRWTLNGFGWKNNELVKILALAGARNVEISGCRFVGGTQRVLDLMNSRLTDNDFENEWATLAWTDFGGEYLVFESNLIHGASSIRALRLPDRHLYVAYNRSSNISAGEREVLTFDVNRIYGRLLPSSWYREASGATAPPWQGHVDSISKSGEVILANAHFSPHAYSGLDVLVVDGQGAGQTRTIADNDENGIKVTQPWDVPLNQNSLIILYQLAGECIGYRNNVEDASSLFEIWGWLFDCTFDGNELHRGQGMWNLGGWYIQWIDNHLVSAVTFQRDVGPAGDPDGEISPERGMPYGIVGFVLSGQFANQQIRFPYALGAILRRNTLSYGYRILVKWGLGGARQKVNFVAARDVIIDRNEIDHSSVGIVLDWNVVGALLTGNHFTNVGQDELIDNSTESLVLGF